MPTSPARTRTPRPDVPRPTVALPTLLLAVAMLGLWGGATWAALGGHASWVVTVPVHAFAGFAMFTVLHDAAHRGRGRAKWASEVLGRLGMLFVAPYGSFPMFRWLHLTHHGHVNEGGGEDPDDWVTHGPAWQLPMRWPFVDLRYLVFWVARVRSRPAREIAETLGMFVAFAALATGLVATGHGPELFLVFVIPHRIMLAVLSWWFDWLPHHGLSATNRDDRYRTTRNIVGLEWLLTPLLFSQNYHLFHHLHPIIPFYRYVQAWRQDEDAHLAHDPALATPTGQPLSVEQYRARRGVATT